MIENIYQFSKTVQEVKKKEPDCRQIARTICCRQAEMPNPRTMLQTTRTTKIRAKCAPKSSAAVSKERQWYHESCGHDDARHDDQNGCRWASRTLVMRRRGFRPPTSSSKMNQTPSSAAHFNPLRKMTYSRSIFPIQRPRSNHIFTVRLPHPTSLIHPFPAVDHPISKGADKTTATSRRFAHI